MSNYVELHAGISSHHKTEWLKRILGIKTVEAVGIRACLYEWAIGNRPGGYVERKLLAFACKWEGDEEALLRALVEAKLVDEVDAETVYIHDWREYTRGFRKSRKDAMRKKRERRAKLSRDARHDVESAEQDENQLTKYDSREVKKLDNHCHSKSSESPIARKALARNNIQNIASADCPRTVLGLSADRRGEQNRTEQNRTGGEEGGSRGKPNAPSVSDVAPPPLSASPGGGSPLHPPDPAALEAPSASPAAKADRHEDRKAIQDGPEERADTSVPPALAIARAYWAHDPTVPVRKAQIHAERALACGVDPAEALSAVRARARGEKLWAILDDLREKAVRRRASRPACEPAYSEKLKAEAATREAHLAAVAETDRRLAELPAETLSSWREEALREIDAARVFGFARAMALKAALRLRAAKAFGISGV